jgi:hypothetical protein
MFSRYKISFQTTNPCLDMNLKTASTTTPIIISLPAHAHNAGEKYFAPYHCNMNTFCNITAALIFIGIFTFNASAQKPYRQFGFKAGMNISNVNADLSTYNTKDIVGGSVSLTYDRVRLRFLTIGGELNLVQRGFSTPVTLTDSMGTQLGVAELRNKFNYFSLPVKIGVQLGNRAYIFGNVAFVPGYLLKAISETPVVDATGQIIDYTWEDVTHTAAQFEMSTQVEAGIGVTKARKYKFYISAAKQQGWTNLFDNPVSIFNIKSTGIIISAGMKLEFGKGLFK